MAGIGQLFGAFATLAVVLITIAAVKRLRIAFRRSAVARRHDARKLQRLVNETIRIYGLTIEQLRHIQTSGHGPCFSFTYDHEQDRWVSNVLIPEYDSERWPSFVKFISDHLFRFWTDGPTPGITTPQRELGSESHKRQVYELRAHQAGCIQCVVDALLNQVLPTRAKAAAAR